MPTGRVLVGAGTGYTAGGTGGNKTVTLTVDQMPSHSHANTLAAGGGHSHAWGSLNNWGRFWTTIYSGFTDGYTQGICTATVENWNSKAQATSEGDWYGSWVSINTKNSAAGATSTVANHNHTITNASTGGGSAVNIEQPWLAVYMWKRTA